MVLEVDEINDLGGASVVLVIGVNDSVDPSAAENLAAPPPACAGREAGNVVEFKRSMDAGYTVCRTSNFPGNSQMLFSNAKQRRKDIFRTFWQKWPPDVSRRQPGHIRMSLQCTPINWKGAIWTVDMDPGTPESTLSSGFWCTGR